MRLRVLQRADSARVEALERSAFESPWSAGAIEGELGGRGALSLGLEADGVEELLAFLFFRIVLDEAELLRIAVAPAARRHGLARRLLTTAEAELDRRGVATVHLEVRRDNVAAIRLYDDQGWSEVGRREAYYADGCDALLFRKELHGATPELPAAGAGAILPQRS